MTGYESKRAMAQDRVNYGASSNYPPQPEQEPVAWRTFDGEGGYDYRSYEDNENYADNWDKRNPKHKGWVDPLYTHPPQRTWVGLTTEDWYEFAKAQLSWEELLIAAEAKLKEKNT